METARPSCGGRLRVWIRDLRLRALHAVDFLQPLTERELSDVVARLRSAPFATGERIMRQGDVAHFLYVLSEGEVEVRVDAGEDGHRVVATIAAPSVFGEMGLMTGEPRSATVVALTEVECFRLDKEAFHALDAAAKQRRVDAEKKRILSTIQLFFGLGA